MTNSFNLGIAQWSGNRRSYPISVQKCRSLNPGRFNRILKRFSALKSRLFRVLTHAHDEALMRFPQW